MNYEIYAQVSLGTANLACTAAGRAIAQLNRRIGKSCSHARVPRPRFSFIIYLNANIAPGNIFCLAVDARSEEEKKLRIESGEREEIS